jgi:putative transcriptional regulator
MKMKKLKELRQKYHYTYDDMAKLVKISKTYYWQIENNKRRLFYKQAIMIAHVFNLKPDEVFYDDFIC